jgi:hypothetical protein
MPTILKTLQEQKAVMLEVSKTVEGLLPSAVAVIFVCIRENGEGEIVTAGQAPHLFAMTQELNQKIVDQLVREVISEYPQVNSQAEQPTLQ